MTKKLDYNKYQSPGIIFNDRGEQIDLTNVLCINQRGEVFVYPRIVNGKHHKGYFTYGRPNETGHTQIGITDNSGRKHYLYIHRLVAFAWLHREPYHTDVLHMDDDPTNNNVTNLKWGTHYDNMQDMWDKRRKKTKYERLTDDEMIQIYTMGKGRDNMKPRHIYRFYPDKNKNTLHPIISGKSKRLINYLQRNPDKNPLLCSVGLN